MKCKDFKNKYIDNGVGQDSDYSLHLKSCSVCAILIESNNEIALMLNRDKLEEKDNKFWSELLTDIRRYIDTKQLSFSGKLELLLPVELRLVKNVSLWTAAAAAALILSVTSYQQFEEDKIVQEMEQEADYFFIEHELNSDEGIFNSGIIVSEVKRNRNSLIGKIRKE